MAATGRAGAARGLGLLNTGLLLLLASGLVAFTVQMLLPPAASAQNILLWGATPWPRDAYLVERIELELGRWVGMLAGLLLLVRLQPKRQRGLWVAFLIALLLMVGAPLLPLEPVRPLLVLPFHNPLAPVEFRFQQLLRVVQCLLCVGALLLRKKGDPILPAALLFLVCLPYPCFWDYVPLPLSVPYGAAGLLTVWLTTKVLHVRKMLVAFSIVLALAGGSVLAHLRTEGWRKSWYGYHVSFDALQFGNINGDEHPDLATYGYKGMVAGNAAWFAGHGDHFDDWDRGHDLLGQYSAPGEEGSPRALAAAFYGGLFVDLDGDGDLDLVADWSIARNDGGLFVPLLEAFRANDRADRRAFEGMCNLWREAIWGAEFDISVCDLTGDGNPDILSMTDDDRSFLGTSRGKLDWFFRHIEGESPAWVEPGGANKTRLVFLERPSPAWLETIQEENIEHRIALHPVPEWLRVCRIPHGEGEEVRSVDLNADGMNELVIFKHTTHGRDPAVITKVSIHREGAKGYEFLGSFSTDARSGWGARLPFSRYQFVDFDKDGRLDLLGTDSWVYRQGENLTFEKAVKIDLKNGDGRAQLFAHDVNGDGWVDIVSSYQPFWNIRFGPILEEASRQASR